MAWQQGALQVDDTVHGNGFGARKIGDRAAERGDVAGDPAGVHAETLDDIVGAGPSGELRQGDLLGSDLDPRDPGRRDCLGAQKKICQLVQTHHDRAGQRSDAHLDRCRARDEILVKDRRRPGQRIRIVRAIHPRAASAQRRGRVRGPELFPVSTHRRIPLFSALRHQPTLRPFPE